jgi:4-hydroxy-3-methylbut-2-en-1-yl diphosphate reductase
MKRILIARNAGFCFGVKRAISIAHETVGETARDAARDPIHSLGPLIHNPQVVSDLERMGVQVAGSADEVPCGTVIIRSHGITRADRDAIAAREVTVVDATCPFVKKAQEHARAISRDGYAVVIVGDPDHPEVRGIISYIEPGVPVITSLSGLREAAGVRKVGIVAQTTQSFENLLQFVEASLKRFPEVRVYNTICNATALRQRESAATAGQVDVMVVLGGYNSANTRRLSEICSQINPNTIHIETAEEFPPEMLRVAERVGITAGASTPEWIIAGFVGKVREIWEGQDVHVSFFNEKDPTPCETKGVEWDSHACLNSNIDPAGSIKPTRGRDHDT